MAINSQDSTEKLTLKERWNRLGRHARAGVLVLALAVVALAVKTGVGLRAETVTKLPDTLTQKSECRTHSDCKGPHLLCNDRHACEALPDPIGACTQPQILTYVGSNGRAKHTFCEDGCILSEKGPRCR